ncbi:MAG: ABC transporter permease [Sphingobacteriaceae bacterium]|nr:ABC transporter permease [Sphingobacteriaceae bacterium]
MLRFILFRYLIAKKRSNFINLITGISFLGVWVGTAALVVVLSVYNGLEGLTESLYSKFNPDLRVRPSSGKLLDASALRAFLVEQQEVQAVSFTLEENALIRYGDREVVGVLKGVDDGFDEVTGLAASMMRGEYVLRDGFGLPYALVGAGMGYELQVSLNDFRRGLDVYMPRRGAKLNLLQPESAFVRRSLQPAGVFDVQPEINQQYMVVPLVFLQELLQLEPSQAGSMEVRLKPGVSAEKVMRQWQTQLGAAYEVKDRYRQEEALFKIFKSEKWWTFFFLLLIVLVAALNLIGSMSMLVIEKQRDIAILSSLGAAPSLIFRLFFGLGMMITSIGMGLGLLSGALLCWLQQTYGFVEFAGQGSFVVSAYPVALRAGDLLLTAVGVLLIGALCAYYPAKRAAGQGIAAHLRA